MVDCDFKGDNEWTLRIKSSGSNENVSISASPHERVADLKENVRHALKAEKRYLRLICKGRLLAPDNTFLRDFKIQDGDVVHAVLAAPGIRGGQQAALARGTTRRYRGTGVNASGRVERSTSEEEVEDESDEEEGRERLGFDRLRASGLSRHEITAIRSYFSRQVDRYVQANPNTSQDEPDALRRRLLQEDAWMTDQGPTSEFRLNLNQNTTPSMLWRQDTLSFRSSIGTDRDFLWGFLLGFFVGFLMLVWVWMPSVPHKQKLGILTGISLQLALSLLRAKDDDVNLEDGV
mmetsp:Transcript_25062/g.37030  ORF Transcript_25062/g.37030 Transcript_25062/m.37030 type:complete len:291 (-) Transcript_25062:1994-2866(-)